ncbi:MAG: complex I NDUFA9 subunit family protein [Pseudomonadota bacterium]
MAGELAVVFGGSGFVGRHVVRELAKRGWRVRVAVRRPHHAQFLRPMGAVGQVDLRQVNIRHKPSIAAAMEGADAVINAVGILFQTGSQSFNAVQAEGAASIAQLAAEAGVERFVHISAIGADAQSESLYARSKAQGENAVTAAIPTATILRPSIVFGPEDDFFNRFGAMASNLPPFAPMPLIGGGTTRFQPVYVDDVADAVLGALESKDARGRIYELGGPSIYTFKELLEFIIAQTGRDHALVPLPFPAAWGIGLVGEFAGKAPFVDPPLTRDQVRLLKRDNVVDTSGSVGVLSELTSEANSIETIVPSYMVKYRRYGQFADHAA